MYLSHWGWVIQTCDGRTWQHICILQTWLRWHGPPILRLIYMHDHVYLGSMWMIEVYHGYCSYTITYSTLPETTTDAEKIWCLWETLIFFWKGPASQVSDRFFLKMGLPMGISTPCYPPGNDFPYPTLGKGQSWTQKYLGEKDMFPGG